MTDKLKGLGEEPQSVEIGDAPMPFDLRASEISSFTGGVKEVLSVVEERLSVGKRRKSTGSVRVGTRTEVVDAVAKTELERYRVEVTRVPVGRVIDEAPLARAEGDVTIISVVEERVVLVKQLFLVEEVHILHVLEREAVTAPVTLRRQRAIVERLDPKHGTSSLK